MAMTSPSRPAPFGALTLHRAAAALRGWAAAQERQMAVARLDDRELADAGLSRAEVLGERYSMFAARGL